MTTSLKSSNSQAAVARSSSSKPDAKAAVGAREQSAPITTSSKNSAVSKVSSAPPSARRFVKTNLRQSGASQGSPSSWWPASAESKLWLKFGQPHNFFMTLPEESAELRGHLVNRAEAPILLHPSLKEHVCEWQPRDDVVLRLSVDPIGCVYIHPVWQWEGDGPFDGDYARVVKASETEWVEFEHTSDPYFLYGARSVRRLPRPKWPTESFETLLGMAMPNRIISDPAHPAIQRFMEPSKAKWGERGFKGYSPQ